MKAFQSCLFLLLAFYEVSSYEIESARDYEMYNTILNKNICSKQIDIVQQTSVGKLLKVLLILQPATNQVILCQSDHCFDSIYEANKEIPSNIDFEGSRKAYNCDYKRCLDIEADSNGTYIRGKYSEISIKVPNEKGFDYSIVSREVVEKIIENAKKRDFVNFRYHLQCDSNTKYGRNVHFLTNYTVIRLGVCIPDACETDNALEFVFHTERRFITFNEQGLITNYRTSQNFFRLTNDKPFTLLDYIAIILIIFFILLVCLGTVFEIKWRNVHPEHKKLNKLITSFSILKNSNTLFSSDSPRGSIESAEGIRALSMLWVILLHSFFVVSQVDEPVDQERTFFDYFFVLSGFYAVDTFLLLSGLLVVYSTIGKFTRGKFLKNLPMFYLNRVVRLYPIMCMVLLLQSSLFNHVTDGPHWDSMSRIVDSCRTTWWIVLLFLQNYLNSCVQPLGYVASCLDHFWYISVDMQLYVISPVLLVFLFGNKKIAIGAISLAIIASIACCTTLSFLLNFSSVGSLRNVRFFEENEYRDKFYTNTIARAPPYFIGMGCGYLINFMKERKLHINKLLVFILWAISLVVICLPAYSTKKAINVEFNNQFADNVINSTGKAIWSFALCWIILACHHGHGGIVNYFLTMKCWKLFARLSYSMYLVHVPLILIYKYGNKHNIITGADDMILIQGFIFITTLSLIVSLIMTLFIEMPVLNVYKILILDNSTKKQQDDKNVS